MTRVLVLRSFPREGNQRASIGMIKQSIERENTQARCGMFREDMYEYVMSLPWKFVRMVHGIGNRVGRRMRSFTRLGRLTFMAKVE